MCSYAMRKRDGDHTLYKQPECTCAKPPCQLLLISRAMYADAISIFYSKFYNQNKFVLRAQIPSDLAALGNLGALALANMTSLSISIRCWPCPRGHDWSNDKMCLLCHVPISAEPLSLSSADKLGEDFIKEWDELCRYLASAISPGQVRLTLVCDVGDINTGSEVIRSLSSLPRLQQCSIRFGRQRDISWRHCVQRPRSG
jgi:hypothetical protein